MKTNRLSLESMYDGEPELAEAIDRMVRAKLIEYVENIDVEIAWNFGEESSDGLTIAVTPEGQIERITNKLPVALFPLSDLLSEWYRHTEDVRKDGDERVINKYIEWLERASRRCLWEAERFRSALAKAKADDEKDEEFYRIFDERYPQFSLERFYNERDAARQELRESLKSEEATAKHVDLHSQTE